MSCNRRPTCPPAPANGGRARYNPYVWEPHHLKLLQLALEAWDRCQMAREILETEGLTVQTEAGIKAHPAIAIERDSRLACARLLRELDLDAEPPAANRFGPPGLFSNRGGNARKAARS